MPSNPETRVMFTQVDTRIGQEARQDLEAIRVTVKFHTARVIDTVRTIQDTFHRTVIINSGPVEVLDRDGT